MITRATNFLSNVYSNMTLMKAGAICCRTFCFAAAAEMAIRSINDIYAINFRCRSGTLAERDRQFSTYKDYLSAYLGGAFFYGLCAFNVVPYASIAGSAIFLIYSLMHYKKPDAYGLSRAIGHSANFLQNSVFYSLKFVLKPILLPLVREIGEIANKILGSLNILISLPTRHPIWVGVALLCTAAAIQNGFFAANRFHY